MITSVQFKILTMGKGKRTNETLERIKQQVNDLQEKGYEAIGMSYQDNNNKGTFEGFLPEVGGVGTAGKLDTRFLKIAESGSPEERFSELFSYTPYQGGDNKLLQGQQIIPILDESVGSKGMGYIPWGPQNRLPNFIFNTAYSLHCTARSLQFLRDEIVGLGVEFVYRWTRYSGGTVVTKEIPYKDAGVLIRGRIMELEAQKRERDGADTLALVNVDGSGRARPGTLEYELDKLRRDYEVWERVNAEEQEFERNNNLHKHFMACMTDFVPMEIYFPLIGLSRGRPGEEWEPKIVSLRHLSCCASRLEQMDQERNINYVYYSDRWRTGSGYVSMVPEMNETVAYPALPDTGTIEALEEVVKRKKNVGVRSRPTWFCIPRRMPCMNSLYYPVPYWWSIYTSELYDYCSTIIADRASARQNSTMWGKIIMVNHHYLETLWNENGCDTKEKRMEYRKKLKENIDNFLRKRKNNGSTVMLESVVAPNGEDLWDSVKIVDVPMNLPETATANKTELSEITNAIFLTMGIHSVLMGNEINSSTSRGGTVQRELDLLKQKQLAPMQKDYLDLLNFVRDWNGWDTEHGVFRSRQMSLSTLDASKTGTVTINEEGDAQ